MVRNVEVESENNTRTIESALQTEGVSLHHRTLMSMPGGRPSIKTSGLKSSFQSEENNSMVAKQMEEYALTSSEAAYENLGEQTPMGFMSPGGELRDHKIYFLGCTGSVHISPT